ncbi:hypothetical protein GCM10010466_15310 [Planomonospora alba]|uniref:Uncharacterized protein n=1 Tax=Planomonospora alba TaxID=161354 RepID=A0ABP6MTA5_9ACTN
MTTTLTPPDSAAAPQSPFRMLSVAADLLPPEIVTARRDRRVRAAVLAALLVFALLLAGWYGSARHVTAQAADEAAAAQSALQDLTRQQREFSELVTVRQQTEAIDSQLSALLADDLSWARLLSFVRRAAPDGVAVTSLSAKITEREAGGGAAAGADRLNTSGETLVGELSITGTAGGKQAVAEYVAALDEVDGLGNALLTDAREQDPGVGFAVRVDVTGAALGGRYTTGAGEGD